MSEFKPFRVNGQSYPQASSPAPMTMEEWEAEQARLAARLGPEVKAARTRTEEEYARDRKYDAPPVAGGGRYETQVWRNALTGNAQVEAQGPSPEVSEDAPKAKQSGNALPGRVR
jgi:hypothetical protein